MTIQRRRRKNVDPTLGVQFSFEVLSHRRGCFETIGLTRTSGGWEVTLGIPGNCDKQGKPGLFKNLDQEGIEYPATLGERLEYLWDVAQERRLRPIGVQRALNALAAWVSHTECRIPDSPFWRPYKRRHKGIACGT